MLLPLCASCRLLHHAAVEVVVGKQGSVDFLGGDYLAESLVVVRLYLSHLSVESSYLVYHGGIVLFRCVRRRMVALQCLRLHGALALFRFHLTVNGEKLVRLGFCEFCLRYYVALLARAELLGAKPLSRLLRPCPTRD